MATSTDGDGGGEREWEKHVDEASGSAYYYNARTGESSWEVPAGFASPLAQESSEDKPPKWRAFVDDESGATYYYDEVSGTSRWDKPDDFIEEEEEEEEEEVKEREDHEPAKSENTGDGGDGRETAPQQEEETEETNEEDEMQVNSKIESGKKEGEETNDDKSTTAAAAEWVKYVDAASNKPYYYNASTGTTQWEEPENFDETAAAAQPAAPQVSAEYQAHLNRMRTERLARVTQQVLDPSGNLSKLNAILSGIDSSAPLAAAAAAAVDDDGADAPRTAKAEWQQHVDAQTQRYYYHNVVTGVTQWNKPDAPIVSGLANWIPPEVSDSDTTGAGRKTVSGVNYVARAKFNRLTGKYEQLGGDEYWQNAGIAPDRAGRQMSHFFDMTELEKNREEARRRKEQLKRKHIDWKKITAEKKANKQKQRNEWLYTD